MMQMIALKSTIISAVGYEEETLTLIIAFLENSVYAYHGVPKPLFISLVKAGSPGRFYNDYIKGKFPSTKIN